MKKLTTEDIQKISLYAPFNVWFEDFSCESILNCRYASGIIKNKIVFSMVDNEIQEFADLSYPTNDARPILRLLQNMTDEEFAEFEKLTMTHNITKEEMADEVLDNLKPEIFLYCLSKHFDLFDLIRQGKAIQKEKSWKFKNTYLP